MTSNQPLRWTQRVAAVLLLSLAVWAGSAQPQASQLVPFRGTVEGTLTVDVNGAIEAPPADMRASHLGQATQVYESLIITQEKEDGQFWLRAEGVSDASAANGDVLRIAFLLEGPLTDTGIVPYFGWYRVLPGGTGRFAYDTSTADLGEGGLVGVAIITVEPETGATRFAFQHRFAGTLRADFSRRR